MGGFICALVLLAKKRGNNRFGRMFGSNTFCLMRAILACAVLEIDRRTAELGLVSYAFHRLGLTVANPHAIFAICLPHAARLACVSHAARLFLSGSGDCGSAMSKETMIHRKTVSAPLEEGRPSQASQNCAHFCGRRKRRRRDDSQV